MYLNRWATWYTYPVICGTPSTTSASATINPGTLSETADGTVAATNVNLDGTNKSTTYSFNINVVDARGTGAGWNLTMQAGQFVTTPSNGHPLAANASTLSAISAVCVTGTTCNSVNGGTAKHVGADLSTGPQIWSSNNTGEGMGSWTVTPTVNVAVPANTYEGTYTSNVTVDLIAGP